MSRRITIKEWNERFKIINPNMELLNKTEPNGTKEEPYILRCKKCGYIDYYTRSSMFYMYRINRCNCKMCSDTLSFPNRICRALLKQLPVEKSEPEYIRKWTNGRFYDGYFKYNDTNYLLEFDGKQHYVNTSWQEYEIQKQIDEVKNRLAKDNGFVLIRIDCQKTDFEYIKNQIYYSPLANLFNLDNLDWNEILNASMGDLFWEIIYFYKDHMDMHNVDIGKVFNLDRHTIKNYLSKGVDMGLIEYKIKKQSKKTAKQQSDRKREKSTLRFYVYDPNGNYLDEFKMYADCERYLKNKYPNIIFHDSGIENALLSNKKYHGFSFYFSDDSIIHNYEDETLINICEFFINNQYLSNTQIAKEFNVGRKRIERCLYRGLASGIIRIEDFTEDAFKIHRFKELREQYDKIKKGR